MKTFIPISLISLVLLTAVSCKDSSSSTTQSSVAKITAFAFAANDSFPGLEEAIFVVEQLADTGLIRMRENDSIRFGTPLDSVVPNITYYTTPSSVTFYLGDSAVSLTGYDTLNLTKKPIRIHVVAQNTDYDKWYKLEFNVHQIDGDLFHWRTVTPNIEGAYTHGVQKAFIHNNIFYYFQNDGYGVKLFTSATAGESWQEAAVSGLPANCDIRQIVEGAVYFFYGKGHDFYYSSDGANWEHISTQLDIVALYMCMAVDNAADPVRLWMAARDENHQLRFYTVGINLQPTPAIGIGLPGDTLPINFPIEEYATVPFLSSSLHEHALIAGGFDRNHTMTAARWSLEYNHIYQTYHLTNLAASDATMVPFAGSSCSYYGKYVYLLGGLDASRKFFTNTFSSTDEGVHWTEVTDTTNRKRPEELKGRYHTNSFVYETQESGKTIHYLYVIGGEDNSTTYSDVYCGRANSVDWPDIGN